MHTLAIIIGAYETCNSHPPGTHAHSPAQFSERDISFSRVQDACAHTHPGPTRTRLLRPHGLALTQNAGTRTHTQPECGDTHLHRTRARTLSQTAHMRAVPERTHARAGQVEMMSRQRAGSVHASASRTCESNISYQRAHSVHARASKTHDSNVSHQRAGSVGARASRTRGN